jgi:hypothetical protein
VIDCVDKRCGLRGRAAPGDLHIVLLVSLGCCLL